MVSVVVKVAPVVVMIVVRVAFLVVAKVAKSRSSLRYVLCLVS